LPICAEPGIGFVPYSPRGRGYLTGKIDETTKFRENDSRSALPRLTPHHFRDRDMREVDIALAETELVMRRPDSNQLVEILGDLLQQGMLDVTAVNAILAEDNASVRFEASGFVRFLQTKRSKRKTTRRNTPISVARDP
jgi:hypothetical protein